MSLLLRSMSIYSGERLSINPLSNPVKMKKTWRGNLKQTYEELVNTFGSLPETPSSSSIQAFYQLPAIKSWREREGVEPTAPTEGPGPTDLKSAKPTRTHPLPRRLRSRPRDQRVRQDDRVANTPARTIIKNLVSGAAPAPEPWERVAHGGSSGNRSGPSHVPQGVFRRLAGLSAVDPCNPPVTLVDLVAVVGDARLDQEPIRRRRVVLSYDLVGRVGIRAAAHAM